MLKHLVPMCRRSRGASSTPFLLRFFPVVSKQQLDTVNVDLAGKLSGRENLSSNCWMIRRRERGGVLCPKFEPFRLIPNTSISHGGRGITSALHCQFAWSSLAFATHSTIHSFLAALIFISSSNNFRIPGSF